MPDNNSERDLTRSFDDDARIQRGKDFDAWCDQLADLPTDDEPNLVDGIIVDIELHPFRWIFHGLDLIQSRKESFCDSILPYPVFQMGAEIFLKGMWLCQFDACRLLEGDSYIDVTMRQYYNERLRRELGHDLLAIIAGLRQIPRYRDDRHTRRFLKIIEGVIRQFYFPFYEADKRSTQWANCRYPKHFYDDTARKGYADGFTKYPSQALIAQLFMQMKRHIDNLWTFGA